MMLQNNINNSSNYTIPSLFMKKDDKYNSENKVKKSRSKVIEPPKNTKPFIFEQYLRELDEQQKEADKYVFTKKNNSAQKKKRNKSIKEFMTIVALLSAMTGLIFAYKKKKKKPEVSNYLLA